MSNSKERKTGVQQVMFIAVRSSYDNSKERKTVQQVMFSAVHSPYDNSNNRIHWSAYQYF